MVERVVTPNFKSRFENFIDCDMQFDANFIGTCHVLMAHTVVISDVSSQVQTDVTNLQCQSN